MITANARQKRFLWASAGAGMLLAVTGWWALLPSRADDAPTNLVEAYQQQLDAGTAKLPYANDGHGYLTGVLRALHIPQDSQLLIFSASSFQFDRINQKTPRAVYFQDNVSIGSVQNGQVIEVIAADSKSGIAFYSLDVAKTDTPHFVRRTAECIICHGFTSRWAPGLMVADSDTGPNGQLLHLDPNNLFRLSDDRTPFENRYGGWYVTGNTGTMRHRGNVTLDIANPGVLPPGGLNVASLSDRIDTTKYLQPGSDIVALLTLEHETGIVNLVTQINAQYQDLGRRDIAPALRATSQDIDTSIDQLAAYMIFADEEKLPSPVKGSSTFATTFAAAGPRDPRGRSLRDFDLTTRMFHYTLSFMVYSQTFHDLNPLARERVLRRVYDVLRGADKSPAFAAISPRDGAAAINILAATATGLPDFWKAVPEPSEAKPL